MDVVHGRCAGIDISKTDAKVCVRTQAKKGAKIKTEVTTWAATSSSIIELGKHLVSQKVGCVVMEATSTYWRPFWHLLSEAGLNLVLANPRQVKQIPGKKTDVADCVWLADLCAHGLVRASFVPPTAVQRLKDLVRARTVFARMRGQEVTRLEKLLEDTAVKLSSAVSDIMGVSGRRMLAALVAGERDPQVLAGLGHKRLAATKEELAEALTGRFTEHHALLVSMHLEVIDSLASKIARLDAEIGAFFDDDSPAPPPAALSVAERADWARKRELLGTIPGVSDTVAEQILAEVGTDMSVFPTAKHLVSWAGVAPGLNQSAGRSKSAKCPKGDKFLKGAVGVSAMSAARHPGTFLHSRYKRVSSRRGHSRALVAVENSILTAVWHILTTGQPYRELGADYYLRRRPGAAIRKAVDQLRAVGYEVVFDQDKDQPGALSAVVSPTPA